LRASNAPLSGSTLVTTCAPLFSRRSPSTHSTYAVADRRRARPDVLRILRVSHFTGASRSTYAERTDEMPSSTCSNTL